MQYAGTCRAIHFKSRNARLLSPSARLFIYIYLKTFNLGTHTIADARPHLPEEMPFVLGTEIYHFQTTLTTMLR